MDIDVLDRLAEIFKDHCNLSNEQYAVLAEQLLILAEDAKDQEFENALVTIDELGVIFDFLYNTRELTLQEYNDLCNLTGEIRNQMETVRRENEGKEGEAWSDI